MVINHVCHKCKIFMNIQILKPSIRSAKGKWIHRIEYQGWNQNLLYWKLRFQIHVCKKQIRRMMLIYLHLLLQVINIIYPKKIRKIINFIGIVERRWQLINNSKSITIHRTNLKTNFPQTQHKSKKAYWRRYVIRWKPNKLERK